jgi:hypothetical protein
MSRKLMASLLFGAALVLVAHAQPKSDPPNPANKAGDKKADKRADKQAVDPLDALIGAALANDADVRVAQAKLQLADAELAKARQAVTQKAVTLKAAIDDQKRVVASAQDVFQIAQAKYQSAAMPFVDFVSARDRLDAAKAQLARLETEMKLLTGGSHRAGAGNGWDAIDRIHTGWVASQGDLLGMQRGDAATAPDSGSLTHYPAAARALVYLKARQERPSPVGAIPDRIRAALDKSVKLGAKDEKVTLQKALEVFKKEAGLDVPARVDVKIQPIVSLGEELPVGAWLQLYADGNGDARFVVREYGLLVTLKDLAPPDALSVSDFWKKPPAPKAQDQTPGPKKADRP